MSTLLIRNIAQLVTCDDSDRILQNVDLYCENGFIKTIGAALDVTADEAIAGALRGAGDTLSAAGIQKAVCGALAAIGHRQGVDVPAGDMETAGDAADVRGGQRAFE